MTVTMRRLETKMNTLLTRSLSAGKPPIFSTSPTCSSQAVALCNFVEMLKRFFHTEQLDLTVYENAVSLKHEEIFELLKGRRP